MGICNRQEKQHPSDVQSRQDLLEQEAHRRLLCQESTEPRHHRMVQHPRNTGEVRHDLIRRLLFRFQECHPEEERGHHGVLLQEACGYSQRRGCARRTEVLYRAGSDGEVQPHS